MPTSNPHPRKKLKLATIPPTLECVPDADLLQSPPKNILTHGPDPRNEITLPDLHGNALKLAWYLIAYDILSVDPENYKKLLDIYQRGETGQLSTQDLETWAGILHANAFNRNAGHVRLMGDELCDRGANDWLTLKLIESMHEAGVLSEIIISNHSLEFIYNIENFANTTPPDTNLFLKSALLDTGNVEFSMSMFNLRDLLNKNLITLESRKHATKQRGILDIYTECYLPHLRALSLFTAFEMPVLFTHAPFEPSYIWELSAQIKPVLEPVMDAPLQTVASLSQSITEINTAFSELATQFNISSLLHYEAILENRFVELCWNRDYYSIMLFWNESNKPFNLAIAHGHDHDDPRTASDHVYVLDDEFGKGISTQWKKTRAPCLFWRRPRSENTPVFPDNINNTNIKPGA